MPKLRFHASQITVSGSDVGNPALGGFLISSRFLGQQEVMDAIRSVGVEVSEEDILIDEEDSDFGVTFQVGPPSLEQPSNGISPFELKEYFKGCREYLSLWQKLEKLPSMIKVSFLIG